MEFYVKIDQLQVNYASPQTPNLWSGLPYLSMPLKIFHENSEEHLARNCTILIVTCGGENKKFEVSDVWKTRRYVNFGIEDTEAVKALEKIINEKKYKNKEDML